MMNTSIVKATLRTNNRALAKALEQKKSEFYSAQQVIVQMQMERQVMLEKINVLQGGDGEDVIKREVDKIIKVLLILFNSDNLYLWARSSEGNSKTLYQRLTIKY